MTVLSLGGTIFMTADETGSRATPDAANAQVAASAQALVPGIALTHRAIANVGSPSVRPAHLAAVLEAAREAVRAGALGVVLTHGTDTLEESAFLLNRYWDEDAPLVLTGAMRPANAPGADGPTNLRDAVRAAASDAVRGLGVLVAFDGALHLADRVTKGSSRSVSAFASEPGGPLALVDGAQVQLLHRPVGPRPAPLGADLPESLPRMPVIALGLGDDGELLDQIAPGAIAGLVVIGSGMGHVSAPAVPRLAALTEAGVPVVIATRIPRGGTSTHHYDYPGSEVDLIARGCTMAGLLRPAQARLLLQAALAAGCGSGAVTAAFAPFAS